MVYLSFRDADAETRTRVYLAVYRLRPGEAISARHSYAPPGRTWGCDDARLDAAIAAELARCAPVAAD